MATMETIREKTVDFADRRELLRLRIDELHTKIEDLKREFLPRIQKAADEAANSREELKVLIEDGKALFQRPKTVIVSGITVGFKKGTGSITFDDEAMVIRKLRKEFQKPEEQEVYIKVTEKVKKGALKDLDVATLKKIGAKVESTGDVVVIKETKSDVEKLLNALLKDRESGDDDDDVPEAA
jgi:hypothetical protein